MDKHALRKTYLQKRNALSAEARQELSNRIARQFDLLPLDGISFIHIFYPIAQKNEVDSLQIVDWLRKTHPEIKLVLSKSNLQNYSLTHIIWEKHTQLALNRWGITEPLTGEEISPARIDVVVVPLLAYDIRGNRIGYGKGFYDKFLSECRDNVLKVGLSFFEPESGIEDIHRHDVRLDICITPQKIWKFK